MSVHPKYGGWFGFRGVIILRNVLCSNLPRIQPLDVLHNDNAKKIELLTKFNFHWEDWSFRDVVTSRESYSEQQRSYFSAKPSERKQWIEQLMRR